MGIFDELARRAPGVLAQHQAGKLKGEATRYDRDREEQEFQARARAEAIQQALMERRQAGEDALRPFRERLLAAQTSDAEAQAAGTGRYAPKPVEPKPARFTYRTNRDGRVMQINEDTREAVPIEGVQERVHGSGGPAAPKLQKVPLGAIKSVSDNNSSITNIRSALSAIDSGVKGLGPSNFMIGDEVKNVLGLSSPEEQGLRADVANVGSLIIHDRSGAAVTISEVPRLRPFIPKTTDKPAVARVKLAKLLALVEEENELYKANYSEEQGYHPIQGVKTGADQPAAPAAPKADLFAKYGLERRK